MQTVTLWVRFLPAVRCENRTRDGWMGSEIATSVPYHPPTRTCYNLQNQGGNGKNAILILGLHQSLGGFTGPGKSLSHFTLTEK